MNLILSTDSYKYTHHLQNPPGTQYKSSYVEARGGDFGYTCFFGLQKLLKDWRENPITDFDIADAKDVVDWHMGKGIFNANGWQYIVDEHGGHLPLIVEAVPEGSCVPHGNVLVQISNTDQMVPWLPAFMETAILRAVWYPSTVATLSREFKKSLLHAWKQTSDAPVESLDFKLHDFGARGVSSSESAMIGGMAHLVNFQGTDTVEALEGARHYYSEEMAGFSIPAAEHSTITAWGQDGEAHFVRNMIYTCGDKSKIIAVVGDSWDIFRFASSVMRELKPAIAKWGGTIVVRPDSGEPTAVLPEILRRLEDVFDTTVNFKGFKVLPDCVRVIWGDGINLVSGVEIMKAVTRAGFSIDNVAFGMGGGLLQQVNRDTCKFAMKTSAMQIGGEWRDVYKDPITDKGKRSKRGRLDLVQDEAGDYETVQRPNGVKHPMSALRTVYKEGRVLHSSSLSTIRDRARLA